MWLIGLLVVKLKQIMKLLSTRILDNHGRIGPFFFKEFLVVFLGVVLLFVGVVVLDLFIPVKRILFIAVPGSFLVLISLVRLVFIKKIDSPWYIHKWMAGYWLKPTSIKSNFMYKRTKKLCFLQKTKKN